MARATAQYSIELPWLLRRVSVGGAGSPRCTSAPQPCDGARALNADGTLPLQQPVARGSEPAAPRVRHGAAANFPLTLRRDLHPQKLWHYYHRPHR